MSQLSKKESRLLKCSSNNILRQKHDTDHKDNETDQDHRVTNLLQRGSPRDSRQTGCCHRHSTPNTEHPAAQPLNLHAVPYLKPYLDTLTHYVYRYFFFSSSAKRLSGRVVKAADLKSSCNPLGNSFVGSNPAAVAQLFCFADFELNYYTIN